MFATPRFRRLRWCLGLGLGLGLGLVVVLAFGCRSPETVEVSEVREPLVIALHTVPRSLDPHGHGDLASVIVLANVYEALVAFDADMRVQPMLATAWSNPDDLTWRFDLRSDVVLHDGTVLDAHDVVASLKRARDEEGSRVSSHLGTVETIRSVGEWQVELVTREPDPLLLNRMPSLFIAAAGDPDVGSGPYRIVASDDEQVTLEAFDRHRGPAPGYPTVRFDVVVDGDERVTRLLDGRARLAGRLRQNEAERLRGSSEVARVDRAGLQVALFMLRIDRPPLDRIEVRRAIDLALDREDLAASVGGEGRRQIVGPAVFGFDPELEAEPPSTEAARRLLRAAGFEDGIDVTVLADLGVNLERQVEQLARAGIRLEVETLAFPEILDRLGRGEAAAAYFSAFTATGDALDLLEDLAHSPTPDGRYGNSNWSGLRDAELDRLIEEAGTLLTPARRLELLQRSLARLDESKTLLPLVSFVDVYGVHRDLIFEPRLDGRILIAEIEPAPPKPPSEEKDSR